MTLTLRNLSFLLMAAWAFRSGLAELGWFHAGPRFIGILGIAAGVCLAGSVFLDDAPIQDVD